MASLLSIVLIRAINLLVRLDTFGDLRRKLLLININIFSYFRKFIDTKNLTKLFTLIDVAD